MRRPGDPPIYRAGPPPAPGLPRLPRLSRGASLALLVPALLLLGGAYVWFVQRIEVPAGKVLVLLNRTGADLKTEAGEQVVLHPALLRKLGEPESSRRFKGIVYDVLAEGRYFYDPFFWRREVVDAVVIEQGEIGLLVRRYGDPLPPGKIVATEPHERGPLAEVLTPARYNLNPYAYHVVRVKPTYVSEGHIGVQTLFSGADPANPNRYVVNEGERGVQAEVLPPGMYYNNPFVRRIDEIDVRSHTIDLVDRDAIHFPSNDSFDILLEGTVEYAIRQDKAPYVMMAIGDHNDIKEKIIMPYAKSFSRIEGSKLAAREFISGEARTAFQQRVFEGLRQQCYAQGIEIRAVLFRRIEPPKAIAGPISDRQVAEQQVRQYENEITLARSQARLVEQEELQKQNQETGLARRDVVTMLKEAEQAKAVALLHARQKLEVARLELEAAAETAAALRSRGQADAEVARLAYAAEARPLADAVSAFGDGETYAQFFFYQRLAPALKSVLASTDGPFADIFRALTPRADAPGKTTGGPAARASD
jgi:regulator of protease activity HflC (stomatin/prohibitin superfamily)